MPGQVLRIADGRRDSLVRGQVEAGLTFTDVVDVSWSPRPKRFLALLLLDRDRVTHAALGIRTGRVATGRVRIRYESIRGLAPVELAALEDRIPARFRHHLTASLSSDGWVPEGTWKAFLEVIKHDPQNGRVIRELEGELINRPLGIGDRPLRVLTEERDALGLALRAFDPGLRLTVPSLSSVATQDAPFLLAMQSADLPEDVGIAHDTTVFDGWLRGSTPAVGATTFTRGSHTLTVANVNRTAIESVLGVDLLYFHAEYRSFVFVQYKRMTRDSKNPPYYRPSDESYEREYERMVDWDRRIRPSQVSSDLPAYRLGGDAFFFKIYANPIGAPPPGQLLKGMYLPLSYWESLIASPVARGPRGGIRITYENAQRHLTNTQFAGLVGNGWIGSSPLAETALTGVIADRLASRHSVTLAMEQRS